MSIERAAMPRRPRGVAMLEFHNLRVFNSFKRPRRGKLKYGLSFAPLQHFRCYPQFQVNNIYAIRHALYSAEGLTRRSQFPVLRGCLLHRRPV